MSRSYRKKPFMAVTGGASAQQDKTIAARCYRHVFKNYLNNLTDFDTYQELDRKQTSHGNTYSWGRDGKQYYHSLDGHDWYRYLYWLGTRLEDSWPPDWYIKIFRK